MAEFSKNPFAVDGPEIPGSADLVEIHRSKGGMTWSHGGPIPVAKLN